MKTLKFEGAGCVPRGEMENCRIRTAFHMDNGQAVYLEIVGVDGGGSHSTQAMNAFLPRPAGFVTDMFRITGDKDDCNLNRIERRNCTSIPYTHKDVLAYVNSYGASFEKVEIVERSVYHVFKDKTNEYNFGDEI